MLSVITEPADKIFSKQDACLVLQSSYDGTPANRPPDNYTVNVLVYIKDEDGPILCLPACLDDEQQVKLNLSKQLHNAVSERIDKSLPDLDNAAPIVIDACCDYRIEYFETYVDDDGNNVEEAVEEIANKRVCYGCIDNECPTPDTYFTEGDGYAGCVPSKQRVGLYQPQYVAWLNCTGSTQQVSPFFRTRRKTGGILWVATPATSVEDGQLLIMPIGPQQLAPYATPEDIACYTIQLLTTTDVLTEEKLIQIDECRHPCERYLLWYNAFCAPQVLRLTGRSQVGTRTSRKIAEYATACGEEISTATRNTQQVSATHSTLIDYRVGYLWKEEVKAIEEMLLMNHFYQITRQGYVSMIIEETERDSTKDCQFLHPVGFSARRAAKLRGIGKKILQDCENPFFPSIQEAARL